MPLEFSRLKQETKTLNAELRARTMGFLVGGLGLVAGLAWNDAVRSLIEHFFPLERNSVLVKFVYAGVITVVVVIFSMYLSRLFIRNDVKDDKEKIDKIK